MYVVAPSFDFLKILISAFSEKYVPKNCATKNKISFEISYDYGIYPGFNSSCKSYNIIQSDRNSLKINNFA